MTRIITDNTITLSTDIDNTVTYDSEASGYKACANERSSQCSAKIEASFIGKNVLISRPLLKLAAVLKKR